MAENSGSHTDMLTHGNNTTYDEQIQLHQKALLHYNSFRNIYIYKETFCYFEKKKDLRTTSDKASDLLHLSNA